MIQPIPVGRVILVLSGGIVAISFSSILTKLCSAPAITIAFYRLSIGSLLYLVIVRRRSTLKAFTARQIRLALLSGCALALHFITWISSLSYTSVASSTTLVVTSPIWVALGSALFLHEKIRGLMAIAISVTLIGVSIISGADFTFGPHALYGNLLALTGAVFAAAYLVLGRRLRADIDTFLYVTAVYGAAALVSLFFALLTKAPFGGFDAKTYALLLGIALFPQVVGHTSLNWTLKYFSATTVAIVSLGEPVGASLLAWLLLGERLGSAQLGGGIIILTGVAIALWAEIRSQK
ncbi:DMT family transporter [candidate division KSB1 bacterium]|nr:DMT family transporter [candidate division KSB1 bacterium]